MVSKKLNKMKTSDNTNKKIAISIINFGCSYWNGSAKMFITKNYLVCMYQNGYVLCDSQGNKIETFE